VQVTKKKIMIKSAAISFRKLLKSEDMASGAHIMHPMAVPNIVNTIVNMMFSSVISGMAAPKVE